MNMPVLLTNLIMVPLYYSFNRGDISLCFIDDIFLLQKAIYMLVISPSSSFSGWNRI